MTRAEQKAATRARVLGAAANRFSTMRYENVTIRLIARDIGMSTGAIFSSFEGKEALYKALTGLDHGTLTAAAPAMYAALAAIEKAVAASDKNDVGAFIDNLKEPFAQVRDALDQARGEPSDASWGQAA